MPMLSRLHNNAGACLTSPACRWYTLSRPGIQAVRQLAGCMPMPAPCDAESARLLTQRVCWQEVSRLGPTMYFGELALLSNEPRKASVKVPASRALVPAS